MTGRRRAARAPAPRIGIFGGTFNPIHLGHLRSAEEVREAQQLDRILFIPSATPPHKAVNGLVTAAHRLAMARLAVAGNPSFRVSTVEIERGGPSYSVDTLRLLRARMPAAQFFFILGIDAFREIATWRDYRGIFALANLVVTSRPPGPLLTPRTTLHSLLPVAARAEFCYRPVTRELEHSTGNRIVFQRISGLEISASAIRHQLLQQSSIRYLVPTSVERYIARHGLYARKVRSR
jgi:nicotinate-nucleotide adenylyltransferase